MSIRTSRARWAGGTATSSSSGPAGAASDDRSRDALARGEDAANGADERLLADEVPRDGRARRGEDARATLVGEVAYDARDGELRRGDAAVPARSVPRDDRA